MSYNNIKDMAKEFRNAIFSLKSLPPEIQSPVVKRFPRGTCGDVCDLFIFYLSQKNIKAEYWNANFKYNDVTSVHAWIQIGEICLDMTADQFNINDELNFPEVICTNRDLYPLRDYLTNIKKGVASTDCLNFLLLPIYAEILDVIENGYSEERIIKRKFKID